MKVLFCTRLDLNRRMLLSLSSKVALFSRFVIMYHQMEELPFFTHKRINKFVVHITQAGTTVFPFKTRSLLDFSSEVSLL